MEMNNSKPLITTIIPTYRRPKLLRRAIKSVLNQTYPHFQVCVYDNASGDETAEVVSEFAKKDPRVKYHCHPENIGALANFNYGMKHVDTLFFSFLSDDDILLPEFYETALEGFEKHPEAVFSSTAVISMNDDGYVLDQHASGFKPGFYKPPDGLFAMLKYNYPTWTGILFRKEIVEKVGILDHEVWLVADIDFELRIAAHFPFVISLKPGAIFVTHPVSTYTKAGFQDTYSDWFKIIRNLIEDEHIPLNVRIFAEQVLTERLKKRLFFIGIRSILQRNDEDAYKVAQFFRNYYHQKTKAFILCTIAKICRCSPPVYYSFVFLNKFRKFLLWKKLKLKSLYVRTALLSPPRNPESLAKNLLRVLEDNDL